MTARIRGIAVTGTDTSVGKTIVSAVLSRILDGVYVKPVQSGAADGDDDAATVRRLAGVPTVTGPVLDDPLAPSVAANRDGLQIGLDDLTGVVRGAAEEHPHRAVVVEGAGGLLVELGTDGSTLVHVAERLHLPVVVVARPGLGTLNHTMLTLEAARRRDLVVVGVIICGMPQDPDLATSTNVAELQRLTDAMVIGIVPILDPGQALPELEVVRSWVGPALGGTWSP